MWDFVVGFVVIALFMTVPFLSDFVFRQWKNKEQSNNSITSPAPPPKIDHIQIQKRLPPAPKQSPYREPEPQDVAALVAHLAELTEENGKLRERCKKLEQEKQASSKSLISIDIAAEVEYGDLPASSDSTIKREHRRT